MIQAFFHYVDIVALWVIWWCAAAGLAGGHEVRTWRSLVLSVGLIALMVFSFCGAIVLWAWRDPLAWWISGLIYGVATVAAWLYEYRFGIGRHLRMFGYWLHELRSRLHA